MTKKEDSSAKETFFSKLGLLINTLTTDTRHGGYLCQLFWGVFFLIAFGVSSKIVGVASELLSIREPIARTIQIFLLAIGAVLLIACICTSAIEFLVNLLRDFRHRVSGREPKNQGGSK